MLHLEFTCAGGQPKGARNLVGAFRIGISSDLALEEIRNDRASGELYAYDCRSPAVGDFDRPLG